MDAFANVSKPLAAFGCTHTHTRERDVVPPLRVCQYASSTQTPCVLAFNMAGCTSVAELESIVRMQRARGSWKANGAEQRDQHKPITIATNRWVTLATARFCYTVSQQYYSIVRL